MPKIALGIMSALLILLSGCGSLGASTTAPTAVPTLAAVPEANEIVADATVVPAEYAELVWDTNGMVTDLLVQTNSTVKKGEPIARVDARDAQLQVQQAQAALDRAKADFAELTDGASPEEVAAAEAQLAQAQGQLHQTQGGVTTSDIAAAQAQLAEARARLAQLEAGPNGADVTSARAQLDHTRTQLQMERDARSAAKTTAYQAMQQAAEALVQAQSTYTTAKANLEEAKRNDMTDLQLQQFNDAYVHAEAAMHSAESAVDQAKVAYDLARQQEVEAIAQAEAQVRSAEAALDKLLGSVNKADIAAARAQVAQATANLSKLQGEQRSGALSAAAAQVENEEANLQRLKAAPRQSALDRAKAQVLEAQVTLDQAKLALERTTLTAPIAGTIAEIDLRVGESPSKSTPTVVIAKLDDWRIETTRLTELQIVRVKIGNPATITFDSLPGFNLPGHVTQINPIGKNREGDITYKITITPDKQDQRLRWNMSASAAIAP